MPSKINVILGFPGSGKSTFAQRHYRNQPIVHADACWFVPNTNWEKRSVDDFVTELTKTIDDIESDECVLEGCADPYLTHFVQTNLASRINEVHLCYISKRDMLASLITRSCRRYQGTEKDNESGCQETPLSRADMVLSSIRDYDIITSQMSQLEESFTCKSHTLIDETVL